MSERLFVRLRGDALQGPESDVPPSTLRGGTVAASLRGHVAHVFAYREEFARDREVIERVLPDGAVRLVFNLADVPSTAGGAGYRVEAIGASTTPVLVRLSGRIEGLSVTLQTGAAAAVLGIPAGALTGSAVDLDDLWAGEGARLRERMIAAPSDTARVALLESALRPRLAAGLDYEQKRTMRAAALLANDARLTVRAAADTVGVGERRLQQLFHTHVGLSPRAWSRLSRLQVLLAALRKRAHVGWAQLAIEAGYYDQAHLINEFRALSGLTPGAFLQRTIAGSSKPDT